MRPEQTRTYDRASSVVFLKTNEPFGGLSNMAGGFPLRVNGMRILTSEALYQACRFPHRPELQALIIEQRSPMTAKMKSKPYRHDSRPDWDHVRVKIMRWCLRVKLAQNWRAFSELLLKTGERPIVEESRKDAFWGAKATDDGPLVGMNVLGRLLMELRETVRVEGREPLMAVQPLAIPDFLLRGRPIEIVTSMVPEPDVESGTAVMAPARAEIQRPTVKQSSLFDAPAVKEAPPAAYSVVLAKSAYVAHLKPYSEYKASSQGWLGEVPRHWSLLPNRALLAEVKDRDHPDEEMLSVTITRGLVKQKELLEGSSKKDSSNLDKSAYKLVQPRDIAYNKMRAWQGAIGVSALRGIISPAYVVMRLRNADDLPSYFHYLYRTPQFAKEAERWSYGITSDMWSLRPEHFKMIYTPEPPPDEQAAIVRFLDWANGRLERAIRAKRKVIALLNEQKQAIIHRAVTRGFDPSVPLKRSRVPWLGDVPKHWGIFPIRRLATRGRASIVNGPFGSDLLTTELVRTGVPVVYIRDISSGQYRRRSRWHVSAAKAEDISFCQVLPGDVLIAKVGDPPGTAAVYPEGEPAAVVTQDVIRLRPNRNVILSEYLVRLLNSSAGRTVIAPIRVESTRGRFSLPEFRALAVELPPIDEQARILEEIWSLERPVVAAASRLEREIELLREYRTRLVADVVTGKLDVREAAARLPDDASLEAVEDNAGLGDEIQAADEEAVA